MFNIFWTSYKCINILNLQKDINISITSLFPSEQVPWAAGTINIGVRKLHDFWSICLMTWPYKKLANHDRIPLTEYFWTQMFFGPKYLEQIFVWPNFSFERLWYHLNENIIFPVQNVLNKFFKFWIGNLSKT